MIDSVSFSGSISTWNSLGSELLSKIQREADLELSRTGGNGNTLLDAMALDEPSESGDMLALIMQEIRSKLGTQTLKSAAEGIKATGDAKETAHKERMDKLKEASEAAEEAKKSGVLGQVFGWIGAALAVIAAVAVAVATFGAAAPASGLAIAGVVAAMTGAVLGMTTQIVTSIPAAMESLGPEGAQSFMWSMMALQLTAAAFSLGFGLASTTSAAANAGKTVLDVSDDVAKVGAQVGDDVAKVGVDVGDDVAKVGAGAGDDVAKVGGEVGDDVAKVGAEAGDEAANLASQTAIKEATKELATKWSKMGGQLANLTRVMEGSNMVGQGANQIYGGIKQNEADLARADAAEFRKLLIQLQAITESETEFVELVTKVIDESAGIVAQIATDTSQATQNIVRNA